MYRYSYLYFCIESTDELKTTKIKVLPKIVHGYQPLTIFRKKYPYTAQKMKFLEFLQQMMPNPQETADLIAFTKEFLNGKLHFLCIVIRCLTGFWIRTWLSVIANLLDSRKIQFYYSICWLILAWKWAEVPYELQYLKNFLDCISLWSTWPNLRKRFKILIFTFKIVKRKVRII